MSPHAQSPADLAEHDLLPFSAFRTAPCLTAAGLTTADMHDGARSIGPWLRHWPMMRRGGIEPHTTLWEVRDWIERRAERERGTSRWARTMESASDWDEMIARACA